VKLMYESEGHEIEVELKNGEIYRCVWCAVHSVCVSMFECDLKLNCSLIPVPGTRAAQESSSLRMGNPLGYDSCRA
jgi:hypothetical protein